MLSWFSAVEEVIELLCSEKLDDGEHYRQYLKESAGSEECTAPELMNQLSISSYNSEHPTKKKDGEDVFDFHSEMCWQRNYKLSIVIQQSDLLGFSPIKI